MNYKNGRRPKSVPLAWRAIVTTHEGLIDRPWPERGKDQIGRPWVDAKTWAVARVLDDHMGAEGTCWVSYGTIAAHARISRTAAKDGVARLVGAGLLERKQRRIGPAQSDSNLYRALGVGVHRPGGGGASAEGWGRTAPQSPHEVPSSPFGPGGPGKRCGKHPTVELYTASATSARPRRTGPSTEPRHEHLLEGHAPRTQDAPAGARVQGARRDEGAPNRQDAVPLPPVRTRGMGAPRQLTKEIHGTHRQAAGFGHRHKHGARHVRHVWQGQAVEARPTARGRRLLDV